MSQNSNNSSRDYQEYLETMQHVGRSLEEIDRLEQEPSVRRVFGFLSSVGLLSLSEKYEGSSSSKLSVPAVLKAGYVEPRVFEVLPAAMYAYPRSFLHAEALPAKLREMIRALHSGRNMDASYGGIHFTKMKDWMTYQLPDKRTKPLGKKKVLKSFMLSPPTLGKIKSLAQAQGISQTEVVEAALEKLSSDNSCDGF